MDIIKKEIDEHIVSVEYREAFYNLINKIEGDTKELHGMLHQNNTNNQFNKSLNYLKDLMK